MFQLRYCQYRRGLIERAEINKERRESKEELKAAKNQTIDSRGGTFGSLEPTDLKYKHIVCKLKFTKTPTKQTNTPIGESKLKAIEGVEE